MIAIKVYKTKLVYDYKYLLVESTVSTTQIV